MLETKLPADFVAIFSILSYTIYRFKTTEYKSIQHTMFKISNFELRSFENNNLAFDYLKKKKKLQKSFTKS